MLAVGDPVGDPVGDVVGDVVGDFLGVGVGVVVGGAVGVGGGVGVGFTYVDTVITMVVPCGCALCGDGLCCRTVPLMALVVLSSTICTLNPAFSSFARAGTSLSPTTLGTFFGPAA